MKLRRIKIGGFKALADVTIDIPGNLLILIGVNGAGKSSILQALAFVRYFALGNPAQFFADRHWAPRQIRSSFTRGANLRFELAFEVEGGRLLWQFSWALLTQSLQREVFWFWADNAPAPEKILSYTDQNLLVHETPPRGAPGLKLSSSVLSVLSLKGIRLGEEIFEPLLEWARGINSLELLNPNAMRQGDRGSPANIGMRGERLSGFLASLSAEQKSRLVDRLAPYYPLKDINTTRKRAGWVDMRIAETYDMSPIGTSHISDGFLRLLALSAIPEFPSRTGMVLLDEVEDGIEPHILPDIIKRVCADSYVQMVMTSHSPLLVNFFDPQEVTLVTRTAEGVTVTTPLSALSTVQSGLEYFGGGEIWAMMDINTVRKEALESIDQESDGVTEPEAAGSVARTLTFGRYV